MTNQTPEANFAILSQDIRYIKESVTELRNGLRELQDNYLSRMDARSMKEEADRRELPFSDFAARQLVKLAIRRAKKAA